VKSCIDATDEGAAPVGSGCHDKGIRNAVADGAP